jgi:hypothetical protein
VLCDDDGKVQGLLLTYSSQNSKWEDITSTRGFPISLLKPTLKSLKRGEIPKSYGLDVEFRTMRIVDAKNYGLSDKWVKKVESASNSKYTLLYIINILDSTSPAGKSLEVGDIVLTINGNMVTRMDELPSAIHYSEEVDMVKYFIIFHRKIFFFFNFVNIFCFVYRYYCVMEKKLTLKWQQRHIMKKRLHIL